MLSLSFFLSPVLKVLRPTFIHSKAAATVPWKSPHSFLLRRQVSLLANSALLLPFSLNNPRILAPSVVNLLTCRDFQNSYNHTPTQAQITIQSFKMAGSTTPKPTQSDGQPEPHRPALRSDNLPVTSSDHSNAPGNTKPNVEDGSKLDTDNTTTKDRTGTEVEGDCDGAEMPKPRPPLVRRDVDISVILNPSQRIELIKLSEAIMAKVEENMHKPFNFLDHPVAQVNRVKIYNYKPVVAAQKAQAAAHADKNSNTGAKPVATHGKKQETIPEEGEPSEVKPKFVPKIDVNSVKPMPSTMSVLKDDSTLYFNKWKHLLNKRMNDLITPTQSNLSAGPSRQGQGGPRGGGAGAGPAGKNQQQGE